MSSYADLVSSLQQPGTDRRPSGVSLRLASVSSSEEPLDLSTVESYVRAPSADQILLKLLIAGVREQVEQRTRRLLVQRQVTASWESAYTYVRLPFPPIDSVSTVEDGDATSLSYERDGQTVTLDSGLGGQPLTVVYTAGYSDVPEALKMQMLRDIASRYDRRGNTAQGVNLKELPDPSAYDQWRVMT